MAHRYCLAAALAMAMSSACNVPPAAGSLFVINDAPQPIAEINLSPAAQSSWGPTQNSAPIPVGGSEKLAGVPSGTYDFRAVLYDGLIVTLAGIPVQAGKAFTVTVSPMNGRVRALNSTGYRIVAVYLSSAYSGSWGPPQNSSIISSGAAYSLEDVPPGTYDFKAVDETGAEYFLNSFSVNAGFTFNLNVN